MTTSPEVIVNCIKKVKSTYIWLAENWVTLRLCAFVNVHHQLKCKLNCRT